MISEELKVNQKEEPDQAILKGWRKFFFENLENDQTKKKDNKIVISITGLLFILTLIWVISALGIYFAIPDWTNRGTFGDMFGAVNALFSAFAFAGLIYTILVQRYELTLQRKELELQREEVRRNGDQLEEQKKIMAQQSFENTFFKLIELHHQIIESLNDGNVQGRVLLHQINASLQHYVSKATNKKDYFDILQRFLTSSSNRVYLEHYINNIVSIYVLIQAYNHADKQNKPYLMIIYNQLSVDEKQLFFYVGSATNYLRPILANTDYFTKDQLKMHSELHYTWLLEDLGINEK